MFMIKWKFIVGVLMATMGLGSPLYAQDVDWDNNDTPYEAPGARDAVVGPH